MNAVILARSGEALKAGPIGLAVILLLCIACYFLFKSMSKHLRTVRENFPAEPPRTAPPLRDQSLRGQTLRGETLPPARSVTSLPESPPNRQSDGPPALS